MMQEVGIEKLRYAVVVQTIQDYVASLKIYTCPKAGRRRKAPRKRGRQFETVNNSFAPIGSRYYLIWMDHA